MILLLYKYIHRVRNKTEYMVERTMQICGIEFGLGIAETVGANTFDVQKLTRLDKCFEEENDTEPYLPKHPF